MNRKKRHVIGIHLRHPSKLLAFISLPASSLLKPAWLFLKRDMALCGSSPYLYVVLMPCIPVYLSLVFPFASRCNFWFYNLRSFIKASDVTHFRSCQKHNGSNKSCWQLALHVRVDQSIQRLPPFTLKASLGLWDGWSMLPIWPKLEWLQTQMRHISGWIYEDVSKKDCGCHGLPPKPQR